jgi:hypothetical protein
VNGVLRDCIHSSKHGDVIVPVIDEEFELVPDPKSHSFRRSSAQIASEHKDVQPTYIVHYGGWTLKGIQTLFNYICGSFDTDSKVARSIGGWTDATEGGYMPTLTCIPESEQEAFKLFVLNLLGSAYNTLPVALSNGGVCVLCMRFITFEDFMKDASEEFLVHVQMRKFATSDQITKWGEYAQTWYHRNNCAHLPPEDIADSAMIPYASIAEAFKEQTALMRHQHHMVSTLHDSTTYFI